MFKNLSLTSTPKYEIPPRLSLQKEQQKSAGESMEKIADWTFRPLTRGTASLALSATGQKSFTPSSQVSKDIFGSEEVQPMQEKLKGYTEMGERAAKALETPLQREQKGFLPTMRRFPMVAATALIGGGLEAASFDPMLGEGSVKKITEIGPKTLLKKSAFEIPARMGTKEAKAVNPLIAEARKFKSADEFVKGQQPIFHGTPKQFDKFDTSVSEGGATWFTADRKDILDNTAGAVQLAGSKLNIMERYPKPNLKLATPEQAEKIFTDQLIAEGYRGVKYPKGEYGDYEWTKLFNPNEDTVTKSQLTDIWNQAQGASGSAKPFEGLRGGTRKIFSTEPKNDGLFLIHNITEGKLKSAAEIGGLANPSLATINPEKGGFTDYGEITLIAPKEMATKGKTFASDIYSPRYPDVAVDISYAGKQKIINDLKKYDEAVGKPIEQEIDTTSDIGRQLENSTAFMMDFAEKQGLEYSKEVRPGYENYKSRELRDNLRGVIFNDPQISEAFGDYLQKTIKDAGGENKLFAGYTPGGKKKYLPYTAENASKLMNKEGLRGGENFNYGLGSMRAGVAPELKSVSQIKKAQARLVGKEEFEANRKQMEEKYFSLTNELDKYAQNKDSNSFVEFDRQSQAISDYISGRDRSWFARKFKDVPKDVMDEVDAFKEGLKNMPTEYFETKFKHPVSLGEFGYALVPDNASKKTLQILKDNNHDVIVYKAGDEADRLRKLKSLKSKAAFAVLPLGGMSLAGEQEKQKDFSIPSRF